MAEELNADLAREAIAEWNILLDEYHTHISDWHVKVKALVANIQEPERAEPVLAHFPVMLDLISNIRAAVAQSTERYALIESRLNSLIDELGMLIEPPTYLQPFFNAINNIIIALIDTFYADHDAIIDTMTNVVPPLLYKCAIAMSYKSDPDLGGLLSTPVNGTMSTLAGVNSDNFYDYPISVHKPAIVDGVNLVDSQLTTMNTHLEDYLEMITIGNDTDYENALATLESFLDGFDAASNKNDYVATWTPEP